MQGYQPLHQPFECQPPTCSSDSVMRASLRMRVSCACISSTRLCSSASVRLDAAAASSSLTAHLRKGQEGRACREAAHRELESLLWWEVHAGGTNGGSCSLWDEWDPCREWCEWFRGTLSRVDLVCSAQQRNRVLGAPVVASAPIACQAPRHGQGTPFYLMNISATLQTPASIPAKRTPALTAP